MTPRAKKALLYFILFDLIFVGGVVVNSYYKHENDGKGISQSVSGFINMISTKVNETTDEQKKEMIISQETKLPRNNPIILTPEPEAISPVVEVKTTPLAPVEVNLNGIKAPLVTEKVEKKVHVPMCVTYGPLNLQEKATMDVTLAKTKIAPQSYIMTKEPLYEIYWNLGANQVQAVELFEAQKNGGPLQDEKFKIRKDLDGSWIVPVSTISGNKEVAQQKTQELEKSANGIGGTWGFKEKSEGYYYQFKDITTLPVNSVDTINQMVSVLKTPC